MVRLTKPDGKYTSAIRLKLKAYEDTGMEPSEIFTSTELVNIACALRELRQYRELGTIDRLRELVQADRDGRCVVFKFGLGSTVYRAWVRPDGSHPFISEENMNTVHDLVNAETWPDAYNTREAADAALKGWQNDHE